MALNPTLLDIENQSHLHAGHAAMQGNTSVETHFKYTTRFLKIIPEFNDF